MCLKVRDRALLAASVICALLGTIAVATGFEGGPRGALVPEETLARLRGATATKLTPVYCGDINGGVNSQVGCANAAPGAICVYCARTAQAPSGTGGPPGYLPAPMPCNTGQMEKKIGACLNGVCAQQHPTQANCVGTINSNGPES
jgi:hypothetical protein